MTQRCWSSIVASVSAVTPDDGANWPVSVGRESRHPRSYDAKVVLTRPLHHAPDPKEGDEDQNRGERAEPAQQVVRAASGMAHRSVMQQRATARRGIRVADHDRLRPRLTGLGTWASVATLAGIMR